MWETLVSPWEGLLCALSLLSLSGSRLTHSEAANLHHATLSANLTVLMDEGPLVSPTDECRQRGKVSGAEVDELTA